MSEVWSFVDKWLLHCWPGIECGDAGGWLSGIGTIAAVIVALYLAGSEQRREEMRERVRAEVRASSAAAMIYEDVYTAGKKAFNSLVKLDSDHLNKDAFFTESYFGEAEELMSMRMLFADLPPAAAKCANKLLSLLQEANQLLGVIAGMNAKHDDSRREHPFGMATCAPGEIEELKPVLKEIVHAASQLSSLFAPIIKDVDHTYNKLLSKWALKVREVDME